MKWIRITKLVKIVNLFSKVNLWHQSRRDRQLKFHKWYENLLDRGRSLILVNFDLENYSVRKKRWKNKKLLQKECTTSVHILQRINAILDGFSTVIYNWDRVGIGSNLNVRNEFCVKKSVNIQTFKKRPSKIGADIHIHSWYR